MKILGTVQLHFLDKAKFLFERSFKMGFIGHLYNKRPVFRKHLESEIRLKSGFG